MYTPRLASDVRFHKYVEYYPQHITNKTHSIINLSKHNKFVYSAALIQSKQNPVVFSWALPYHSKFDPPHTKDKKPYIEKIRKQYLCGSCWAISLAQIISDCLVVGNVVVKRKPMISATYIMAENLTQKGCLGGNPAEAVKIIEQRGVMDQTCVDYSWCTENSLCNANSLNHFNAKKAALSFNKKIPPFGKCYYGSIKKFIYKLNPDSHVFMLNHASLNLLSPDKKLLTFRTIVQTHILEYGPVLGGFAVLTNFMNGEHTNPVNQTKGIYFENIVYGRNHIEHAYNEHHSFAVIGMHAVSVVGWGVEKNIMYRGKNLNTVYYWHCRNTWGTEWGYQNGFFKIAAYPINKISQFDMEVPLPDDPFTTIGSILMIRATLPLRIINSEGMSVQELNKLKLTKAKEFYQVSEPIKTTSNKLLLGSILISVLYYMV
ncbi:Papain-like proteinase [Lymphocystis disease virus 1]|uniref:Papain-like proteinase n=1 Tax=Fish lymphocystis disease virus TaxID=36363 RepID=UPI0000161EB4|nr:Papain-like proteinase [Lymphocystis disease virus 1]